MQKVAAVPGLHCGNWPKIKERRAATSPCLRIDGSSLLNNGQKDLEPRGPREIFRSDQRNVSSMVIPRINNDLARSSGIRWRSPRTDPDSTPSDPTRFYSDRIPGEIADVYSETRARFHFRIIVQSIHLLYIHPRPQRLCRSTGFYQESFDISLP